MNINDFHKYITQPELLNASTLAELQEVLVAYPYFQTVHILYLKSLFNQNNFKFNNQLKYSSVHINNRKKLFFYLKDKTVNIEEDSKKEEDQTNTKSFVEKKEVLVKGSAKQEELLNTSQIAEVEEELLEQKVNNKIEIVESKKQSLPKEETDKAKVQFDEKHKAKEVLEKRLQELKKPKDNTSDKKIEEQTNKCEEKPEKEGNLNTTKKEVKLDKIQQFLNKTSSFDPVDDGLIDLSELIQVEAPSEYFIKENTAKEKPVKEGLGYWVNYLKNKEDSKKKKIVDDFLKNKKSKTIRAAPNVVHETPKNIKSKAAASGLMTETLAEIYMQQGHYKKALLAYEKLSLKNPKKNTYFANQIKKIKKLQLNT